MTRKSVPSEGKDISSMFKHKQSVSLRRYWMMRYLFAILTGVIVLSLISVLWIRSSVLESRLNTMAYIAEDIAIQLDANELMTFQNSRQRGRSSFANRQLMNLNADSTLLIIGKDGNIHYRSDAGMGRHGDFDKELLDREEAQVEFSDDQGIDFFLVKHPVMDSDGEIAGWVALMEQKEVLTEANQQYAVLFVTAAVVILFGWSLTALMANKLSRPITEAALVADQVKKGNYQTHLPDDAGVKEIDELNHSFKEMTDQLQQAERLRVELLAGVTHELKTPVTSITGLIEAVKDGVVDGDEAQEFLTMSLHEAEQLRRMIADLLTFNQFTAGNVTVQEEIIPLEPLLKRVIQTWKASRENVSIDLKIMQDTNESIYALIDPMRLEQILHNLIRNAVNAAEETCEISLTLYKNNHQVCIQIADNGPGIPPKDQNRIFERFYRGSRNLKTKGGLGIGLPLSRMMAEALGGSLELIDTSSKGTIFEITLNIK